MEFYILKWTVEVKCVLKFSRRKLIDDGNVGAGATAAAAGAKSDVIGYIDKQ